MATTLAASKLADSERAHDLNDGVLAGYLAGDPIPEIILVDSGEGNRLVVLEGHVRATAMALAGTRLPPLTAILGRGAVVAEWDMY